MDKQELQKNIALYYSKLTPQAQKVFSDMAWLETLKNICSDMVLTEEETSDIATETTLFMLGAISYKEYEETIKNNSKLSADIGTKILEQINNSILKDIKGDLEKVFAQNEKEMAGENDLVESNLDQRFASLSTDIQRAIKNSGYANKLYAVAQKHKLTVDQMGKLEEVTVNIMLGATSPDKFADEIKSRLSVDETESRTIVNEVNDTVLKDIRREMMGVFVKPEEKAYIPKIVRPAENETKPVAPQPVTLNAMELEAPEVMKSIVPPVPVPPKAPVLSQKLGGTFQMGSQKTEHSLDNIAKPTTPKAPVAYPPKADPYRLSPDE